MFPSQEEEVTLEKIEFDWIEKCTSLKSLRRAQKILKDDGGYYVELEKALAKRIEELSPAASKTKTYQGVDPETKKLIQEGIFEWEAEANEKEARRKELLNRGETNAVFDKATEQGEVMDEDRRKRLAENEKSKGNEAITAGDLKEALKCYTKSIQYYDKIAATFCNRALVYLKNKDYKSCVADCDKALALQSDYSKAFHRKAKANFAMGNYRQAVEDFQKVMVLEPKNTEVNGELMEARKKLSDAAPKGQASTSQQGGFKRVAIQEESESDEEDEKPQNGKTASAASATSNKGAEGTTKLTQLIDDVLLAEQGKTVGDKLKRIDEWKAKANELLKTGMYENAIAEYEKGLKVITDIKLSGAAKDSEHNISEIKATLLNNIAYCNMQMDLSENVIKFASQVIDIENIEKNTRVKAHLRRALAYEKIDKIAAALRDFEIVKSMDPGNVQASQALHRLHKIINQDDDLKRSIEKSRSQELEKSKSSSSDAEAKATGSVDHALFEEMKNKGNNFFKDKNFDAANKAFSEARNKIEEQLKGDISADDKSKLEKLYVQVLSNAAMCCFNMNDIEQSLNNCEKALKVDSNHQKCLYRKALCQIKLGDKAGQAKGGEEIERAKKQLDFYDSARKILEELLHQDKTNNDIKTKLSDLISLIVPIRMKHKLVDQKPAENKKIEVQAETQSEEKQQEAESDASKKKAAPKTNTYKLPENYIDNVVKTVTDDLITKEDLPTTSNRFEINCQSFKKNIDKLYFYVKKLPVDHLVGLYKEKTIPTDMLLSIVNSVGASGVKDDPEYSLKLLQGLPNTYKFNIAISQTIKKEKKEINTVLQELQKSVQNKNEVDGLFDKYSCRGL